MLDLARLADVRRRRPVGGGNPMIRFWRPLLLLAGLAFAVCVLSSPRLAWSNPSVACYYIAPDGDDARNGLTPECAWRSLERVNAARLAPGDKVLFQRGGLWRGQLRPQSGAPGAPITYGAYGEGDKPALLGSVALNQQADWRPVGPDLWITAPLTPKGDNLLTTSLQTQWRLYSEHGALATGQPLSDGYALLYKQPGLSGSDLQLYLAPFSIQEGVMYRLRFRIRATQPCKIQAPRLMATAAPWGAYVTGPAQGVFTVEPGWTQCEQLYLASRSASDARLTFYLGGKLPAGAALTVTSMELLACDGGDRLPLDVGNIIFDHGAAWGVKKWAEGELKADLEYWYDPQGHTVTLRSPEHPARRYTSVELALRRHIIDQASRSHVTYEDLALRYGAAHGVSGAGAHHIILRECDISWIGGGHHLTLEGGQPVRYGNGVEFWGHAHDNLVEDCRLWQIYDAALTNQNQGVAAEQYNIVYRRNMIWDCEYAYEYWNRPVASQTRDIFFEQNWCYNAGGGWGHAQRPTPAGRHLCFYANEARTSNLTIRDNIFCLATQIAFDASWWTPEALADRQQIRLDRNCWIQPQGLLVRLKGKEYTPGQFAAYQRETGQDRDSQALTGQVLKPH